MAKYGSPSVTISIDDSPGGTLQDITQYVREIGGVKIENLTQETQTFGDSWIENTPTGMGKIDDIAINGFFDDTATTGPHAVLQVKSADRSPGAATRTLTIDFTGAAGGSFSVEGHMASYEVLGKNGNLTEFAAIFRPSGSGAWS